MFGSDAFQVIQKNPDHLTIAAPGSSLFGAWLFILCILLFPLLFGLVSRSAKRSNQTLRNKYPDQAIPDITPRLHLLYVVGGLSTFGIPILFWAIGYTQGSLDFDRSTNRATITSKMTAFLPVREKTVELVSIEKALLDQKPNSQRIRLATTSGSDLAYPIWSDKPGQQEAVTAINHFLETRVTR